MRTRSPRSPSEISSTGLDYFSQGGYTDPSTLVYFIDRYYDPATDQFLSVDPDVAETGQPYAFTGDDPLNATDPLGLVGGCTTDYCGPDSGEIVGPSGRGCTENCNPGSPSSPGACNADCEPGSVGPLPGAACGADPSYCELVQKAADSGDLVEYECLTGQISCSPTRSDAAAGLAGSAVDSFLARLESDLGNLQAGTDVFAAGNAVVGDEPGAAGALGASSAEGILITATSCIHAGLDLNEGSQDYGQVDDCLTNGLLLIVGGDVVTTASGKILYNLGNDAYNEGKNYVLAGGL